MAKIGLKEKDKGRGSSVEEGCKSIKWILGLILVLFTLILAAILVNGLVLSAKDSQLESMSNENISAESMPPESSVWAAIIILAIVFLLLLYMGCAVDGSLDQGEMRRAIAGTFVLGFTMLIFFLARFKVENGDIITSYLQMVGVIIGFYFGAKTALAGTSSGSSEGLAVEFVEVSEDKKNIILTIRNKGDNKLVVDKVYITGIGLIKPFETSVTIDPKTSTKTASLPLDEELKSGDVIKIKVVANTGLADEMEHKVL